MKTRELAEKVKSGEIVLDFCGHHVYETRDIFVKRYEKLVADENGASDGKWNVMEGFTVEETDQRMRDHFRMKLDFDVTEDGRLLFWDSDGNQCRGCSERMQWVLDGDKLSLRHYWDGKDFKFHPLGYRCKFETPLPTSGEIKVNSRLIFANFFRHVTDEPKGKKFCSDWSVDTVVGRENITKHKAHRNVAYGQMTNTSVGIFVRPDKMSVIVGDRYVTDSDRDRLEIDGHKLVGQICLDVWRWEATDLITLGEKRYANFVKEHKDRGLVEIDVPHGVWWFEHFFDSDTSSNECVYAVLKLKI